MFFTSKGTPQYQQRFPIFFRQKKTFFGNKTSFFGKLCYFFGFASIASPPHFLLFLPKLDN